MPTAGLSWVSKQWSACSWIMLVGQRPSKWTSFRGHCWCIGTPSTLRRKLPQQLILFWVHPRLCLCVCVCVCGYFPLRHDIVHSVTLISTPSQQGKSKFNTFMLDNRIHFKNCISAVSYMLMYNTEFWNYKVQDRYKVTMNNYFREIINFSVSCILPVFHYFTNVLNTVVIN